MFEPTTKYDFYSSDNNVNPAFLQFKDLFSLSFVGSIGYKRYFRTNIKNLSGFIGVEAITSGGKYYSDTTGVGTFGSNMAFSGSGNSATENGFVLNQRKQNDFLLRAGAVYIYKMIYAEASLDLVNSLRKFEYYGKEDNSNKYQLMSSKEFEIVPSITVTAGFNLSYFMLKRKRKEAKLIE
jgi:hypothetical protein